MIRVYLPGGGILDVHQAGPPSVDQMHQWLEIEPGYLEHVAVLYEGKRAQMWVDESGRLRNPPRSFNAQATDIYLNASRARGSTDLELAEIVASGRFIVGVAVLLTPPHELD